MIPIVGSRKTCVRRALADGAAAAMMAWLVLGLGVATPTAAARPGPAGPTLDVANPTPGDRLQPGALVMQGIAFDADAEEGVGVDRVVVFLGDRDVDKDVQLLGEATLGLPSPVAIEQGDPQFVRAGWSLRTIPIKATGQHRSIYVYARSAVTGQETVAVIPVILGEAPPASGGAGAGEEGGPED